MTGRDTSARTGSAGRLTGMAAVVTGGGSGIGRAVIARYVEEGASVSVLERDADRARLLTDAYGDRVVVTEDTVTRGTSLLEAAHAVQEAGAEVVLLVAVVDRGGTVEAMAAAEDLPFQAVLTAPDLGFPYEGA